MSKPQIEALNPTTGDVIYTFSSMRDASEAGYKRTAVQDCIDGKKYEYASMLWRRSGEPIPRPPVDVPSKATASWLIDQFVAECLHEVPGVLLPFGDFYDRFQAWLPPEAKGVWSRIRVSRSMPAKFQSGTGNQNKTYVINAAFQPGPAAGPPYYIVEGRIKTDAARPPTGIAVEAVDPETGAVVHQLRTITAAGKMGFNPEHVSACVNGKQKLHHGLRWRRLESQSDSDPAVR